MTWKFGRQSPDNTLMRFVATRFPYDPEVLRKFLDIGSGEGANARELISRGYAVVTVDKEANADFQRDIRTCDFFQKFDCVYDVNTLCHVENPPFVKIRSWLRPHGVFFSIWPAFGTWPGVVDGKAYTNLMQNYDLHTLLQPLFSQIEIYGARSPAFRGPHTYLDSWIIEARP